MAYNALVALGVLCIPGSVGLFLSDRPIKAIVILGVAGIALSLAFWIESLKKPSIQ